MVSRGRATTLGTQSLLELPARYLGTSWREEGGGIGGEGVVARPPFRVDRFDPFSSYAVCLRLRKQTRKNHPDPSEPDFPSRTPVRVSRDRSSNSHGPTANRPQAASRDTHIGTNIAPIDCTLDRSRATPPWLGLRRFGPEIEPAPRERRRGSHPGGSRRRWLPARPQRSHAPRVQCTGVVAGNISLLPLARRRGHSARRTPPALLAHASLSLPPSLPLHPCTLP